MPVPDADEPHTHAPHAFESLDWQHLTPDAQAQGVDAFLQTMRRRRSVRAFSADPVPYALIEQAVRAAALAPSGANQQPWTFALIGDAEIKRRIRVAAEAEERESYERRMSAEWLEALAPLGTDWHKPFLETAPWLIVVFEQVWGPGAGDRSRTKHYYPKESVGIAVGLLLAALTHAGLATLTHTPSPMKFLSEILGRPENERAFCLLPVGYPAADAQVPVLRRKAQDEVLVRYG